jgi:hypothetical protein
MIRIDGYLNDSVSPMESRTPISTDLDHWSWRNPLNALPLGLAALIALAVILALT